MTQKILALHGNEVREWVFPAPEEEVIPGVPWGRADAAFSPAYWALQLRLAEGDFSAHCFLTGETLFEETVFCLLGGHGISYELNVAAFKHLQQLHILAQPEIEEQAISSCLMQPLTVGNRQVKYRFPNRRASFVAAAHKAFRGNPPPDDDLDLRSWLMALPGVGPKTASWIVRNWMDSDAVAIIDIHLHRAGLLAGLFDQTEKIERDYFKMEQKFLRFANALATRPSLLDGLIWAQMREMPVSVRTELDDLHSRTRGNLDLAELAVA